MNKKIIIIKKHLFTKKTNELISDLLKIIPNSEERIIKESTPGMERNEMDANNIKEYKSDVNVHSSEPEEEEIVINFVEDIGPQFIYFKTKTQQFVFKIIEYRSSNEIAGAEIIKMENSQLVLSNFSTDFGMIIAELFMLLFPINLESNQVVNLKAHKDFIFFRMYRFIIRDKGPVMKNIGPYITLRLWRMTEYVDDKKITHDFKKYIKNLNLL